MSLNTWPETERPREKLLRLGSATLSEAELLAILLQTGTRGCSALEMARAMLAEFRSLRGLLTADRHLVCRMPGLGDAKFALLQAALELARRHYVHPRDVVKLALTRNAAAVILAHNHPSGVAEPSQADELITGRLREALALVDIRVLDHIVVGDGACVSFAERGML